MQNNLYAASIDRGSEDEGAAVTNTLEIDVGLDGQEMTLTGRLDAQNASVARSALYEALGQGEGDLVVRVPDLEIWDGTGMGVLVGVCAQARRRGRRLVLTEVGPRQFNLLRGIRAGRLIACDPVATG